MSDRFDISEMGKRIKLARKRKFKTQEAFADALHVTRDTVIGWETGKRLPDLDNLIAASDLLDVDLDYLTQRIDNETHGKQYICDETGLSPEAVKTLQSVASDSVGGTTLFFYRQIMDALNTLITDINRMDDQYSPILYDIDTMLHASQLSLSINSRPELCEDSEFRELYVYNSQTGITEGMINGGYSKQLILEALKTQIFDKLRDLSDLQLPF